VAFLPAEKLMGIFPCYIQFSRGKIKVFTFKKYFLVMVLSNLLHLSFELKMFRRCCWRPSDTHRVARLL